MPTLAYLRVSKHTQDVNHQRLAILEFARRERLTIDEFIAVEVSSRRSAKARKVGELVAERAKSAGVEGVVFDRAGNKYHGRVAALADGAREGGLTF